MLIYFLQVLGPGVVVSERVLSTDEIELLDIQTVYLC